MLALPFVKQDQLLPQRFDHGAMPLSCLSQASGHDEALAAFGFLSSQGCIRRGTSLVDTHLVARFGTPGDVRNRQPGHGQQASLQNGVS
ncbi:MAG: hypothetical protein QFE16_02225 [Pseudomonadota bacterium]|nr:hypothetical protein [Pseudomonadota bacterium]